MIGVEAGLTVFVLLAGGKADLLYLEDFTTEDALGLDASA